MRFEYLMVTYRKDWEFAGYTLRALRKYGTGHAGITLVVPYQDGEVFAPLAKEHGATLRLCLEHPAKGFLQHQVCKCEADLWCPPGTDYVIHIDADCVFGEPFTVADFMDGAKPLLLRERYDDFPHHKDRQRWQHNVEHALGGSHPWETMVRHPSVYHVGLYRAVRDHIERLHGYPFHQYVLLQRNEFPQTFAEFPTLGAFCLAVCPERYRVVDAVKTPGPYWAEAGRPYGIAPVARDAADRPLTETGYRYLWHQDDGTVTERDLKNPIRYFWSKRGVTPEYRRIIEQLLAV